MTLLVNAVQSLEAKRELSILTDRLGKGSGLGLWLASRSVERHHGEIEVWSQVGTGTRFTITLPISQPDAHGA